MTNNILYLVVIIAFSMLSCGRKAYLGALNQPIKEKQLSADAVQADLDYLQRSIEQIVPFPYLYKDSSQIAQIYETMKGRGEQDILSFYKGVLEIIGSYDASHFFVQFPTSLFRRQLKEKHQGLFPFYCSLEGEELIVDKVLYPADSIWMDFQVERINGLDADSLFRSFYRYTGGAETTKHYDTRSNFFTCLWLNKVEGPFHIEMTRGDNEPITIQHQGYYLPEKSEVSTPPSEGNDGLKTYVQYRQINEETAYLEIKRFWGFPKKEYFDFLEQTFYDLKEKGMKCLLVDLRGNGGGNDRLCIALLHYLVDRPYRMYGGQHRKVSKAYNKYFKYAGSMPWIIRQIPYGFGVSLFFSKHPTESKVYSSPKVGKEAKLVRIKRNPLRFDGDTYFIIDNGTYSSAVSLANAVEDFDLGTLIGQPSGSIPNEHGEIMQLKLPNSGLGVYLPSAFYVRANMDLTNPNPVLPEHFIPRSQLRNMSAEDLVEFINGIREQ